MIQTSILFTKCKEANTTFQKCKQTAVKYTKLDMALMPLIRSRPNVHGQHRDELMASIILIVGRESSTQIASAWKFISGWRSLKKIQLDSLWWHGWYGRSHAWSKVELNLRPSKESKSTTRCLGMNLTMLIKMPHPRVSQLFWMNWKCLDFVQRVKFVSNLVVISLINASTNPPTKQLCVLNGSLAQITQHRLVDTQKTFDNRP